MATLTVVNLTANPVYCSDLYATLQPNGTISTTRNASDLPRMQSLQALITAGTVSASVQYTANELGSGLVGQGLPQGSATGIAPEEIIRVPFTAGAGGSADDITVYAVGALPAAKLRILDMYVEVATAVSASTLSARSAAAGGGTLCAQCASAATGRNGQNTAVTASQVLTNGASVGLFIHRSDNGVAGEAFITVRPET
jgi:hypothetical protein